MWEKESAGVAKREALSQEVVVRSQRLRQSLAVDVINTVAGTPNTVVDARLQLTGASVPEAACAQDHIFQGSRASRVIPTGPAL